MISLKLNRVQFILKYNEKFSFKLKIKNYHSASIQTYLIKKIRSEIDAIVIVVVVLIIYFSDTYFFYDY